VTKEQSGRKYNRELFWESFKECKTELQPQSLNERTVRWQMEARSEGEQVLSDITDELQNEKDNEELGDAAIRAVAESENENGNKMIREDEIAQDVLIDIDPAMIGALHSHEAEQAGQDEKRIPQPTEETFEGEDARNVKIGRRTIPNVNRARTEK
jgi:hypothetical protein